MARAGEIVAGVFVILAAGCNEGDGAVVRGGGSAPVVDAGSGDDAADGSALSQDTSDVAADAATDTGADATEDAAADGSSAADAADGSGAGWPASACRVGGAAEIAEVVAGGAEVRCGALSVLVRLEGAAGMHVVARPAGAPPPQPSPAVVEPWLGEAVTVGRAGDEVWVCGTDAAASVRLSDCGVQLHLADGSESPSVALSSASESVVGLLPGDRLYGLGEKTGALERLGRRYRFWNTDAYDSSLGGWRPDGDPLYLSIPFGTMLREGRAWGLFFDMPQRLEMDAGATDASRWRVQSSGAATDLYLIAGPGFGRVVERYTSLTGRPMLPPRWSLGWHQSRWGYGSADEVTSVASRYALEEIGLDAMWLDIQHMRGFRTFTWDPVNFASPEALDADLAALGVRTVFIADPGIKQEPGWEVYDRGLPYFLRNAAGELVTGSVWAGVSTFADFTLPNARRWWGEELAPALRAGMDGVWLDVNEPTTFPEGGAGLSLPDETPVGGLGAGATMADAHNLYGLLEAQATYDGMLAARPSQRPFVLSRAGYAGLQRYAATWTGDAPSTWASLRQTPAMLTGLSLSGMPFAGSDIGGYSGGASVELYARWLQVGALSPFARLHVTSGVAGQEPWMFGTEVRDIARETVAMRYALMPFLYALAAEQHRTGLPMLRPTVWNFADEVDRLDDDAVVMLGDSLLAAPVVEAGATERRFYLPAGRWLEWRSGRMLQGGAEVVFDLRLAALPMLLREGAMVPHVEPARNDAGYSGRRLLVDLFAGDREGSFVWYEDAGDGAPEPSENESLRDLWLLSRAGDRVTFSSEPIAGTRQPAAARMLLRFRRTDAMPIAIRVDGRPVRMLDGAAFAEEPGTAYWDSNLLDLVVAIEGLRSVTVEVDLAPVSLGEAPPLLVPFEVTLPPDTPAGAVYVASDAWGWTHRLLDAAPVGGVARGMVEAPRGRWYDFKFTRGGWETVEKWPGCVEALNRYAFGEGRLRRETVYAWRDVCGN